MTTAPAATITHETVRDTLALHGALTVNEIADILIAAPATIRRRLRDMQMAGDLGTGFSPMANATTYFITPPMKDA